uniref:CSON000428 protein n=1 Tax=Culicoides sonorensis TaxID=179676 RepID=A0A336MII6_CULSO
MDNNDRAHGKFSRSNGIAFPQPGPSGESRHEFKRTHENQTEYQPGKRQRTGPRHGKIVRRPRVDLEATLPPDIQKSQHRANHIQDQQVIRLKSNFFHLTTNNRYTVYLYSVKFEPEYEETRYKKGIFYRFVENNEEFLNIGKIFNGSNLYTTSKLENDVTTLEGKDNMTDNDVKITIKFDKSLSTLHSSEEIYQSLNTILRRAIEGLSLTLIRRNLYDPEEKTTLYDLKLEIWPGYVTSVRQRDAGLLMCCEFNNKIMRTESVYDDYMRCRCNLRDWKEAFKKEVLGSTVLTNYNKRTYRIDDVHFEADPQSTFDIKDGKCSYYDYYHTKYGITIKDLRQPLLIHNSKKKQRNQIDKAKRGDDFDQIMLIPELCYITGLSDGMRSNNNAMKAIANKTRLDASARVRRLDKFQKRINATEKSRSVLENYFMTLNPNLVEFEGRLIPKPKILFDRNQGLQIEGDFSRNLVNKGLFRPGLLDNWVVLSTERYKKETHDFCRTLKESVQSAGLQINYPRDIYFLRYDNKHEYYKELQKLANKDPQIILIVVPNNQEDRYKAIKKFSCITRIIPTQVVMAKTILLKSGGGRNLSVATKVAVQMSCKIGGAPWAVRIPLEGILIIGFDVSHNKQNGKSFSAMVACFDHNLAQFFSCVSEHKYGEQISTDFTLNVQKAIKAYQAENYEKKLTRLVIYRDGVGEGQIAQVLEYEKKPVEETLKTQFGEDFGFAFVIVNKKTKTRIFHQSRGYEGNPPAGTVCDTHITLPERYDFFLIPADCRHGAVSPTYFNVIHDTTRLAPAIMQKLTYHLCFGYFNWSNAITVPDVVKYAGKLAFLCSQYLQEKPPHWQEKSLYFL